MDLRSGHLFWPRLGAPEYAHLQKDESCDVAVIGAGLSGAMVAHALAGLDVVVLDKREPGCGSTAASTALLMCELDVPLHKLAERLGGEPAARCYKLGVEAIADIERLTREVGNCGFERRSCVYLASREEDAQELALESTARRRAGLEATLLSGPELRARYSLRAPCAIVSHGAQVDGFALTHALLKASAARVFSRAKVESMSKEADTHVLRTSGGQRVVARRVVVAAGYEARELLRVPGKLVSTYAVATTPIERFEGWVDRCMLWESARPYLYIRTTPDNRAIIGGGDEAITDPDRRDELITGKTVELMGRFRSIFPAVPAEPALAWAGFYLETKDSLPYIGEVATGVYAALCYGANGSTFARIAAKILRGLIVDGRCPDAELFKVQR